MCAFGKSSQSTRNTMSTANCAPRTMSRLRRSPRSHSAYCGLAAAANASSAFDMDFELLPEGVEVFVEFRRIARGERSGAPPVRRCEADRVVRLDLAGPARQYDDPLGHADRLADVVGDEDRGLTFAPQNLGHLVGERDPRLRIKRREWLVEQHDVRIGAKRARESDALAHPAGKLPWQIVQELAEPVAGEQHARALARFGHVRALNFCAQ